MDCRRLVTIVLVFFTFKVSPLYAAVSIASAHGVLTIKKSNVTIRCVAIVTNGGQRVAGAMVAWSANPASMVNLTVENTVTNDLGRSYARISGTGTTGNVQLTATAFLGMMNLGSNTVTFTLNNQACNVTSSLNPSEVFNDLCGVKYKDNNSTFGDAVFYAKTNWNNTVDDQGRHHVNLVAAGEGETQSITFIYYCDPNGFAAQTVPFPGQPPYTIKFNKWWMRGDPNDPDPQCRSDYPEDLGANRLVGTHEVGHAFGFDHNADLGALMYENVRTYFECGTATPTSIETLALNEAYPACPMMGMLDSVRHLLIVGGEKAIYVYSSNKTQERLKSPLHEGG